jgi:ketosteroid isomerase-like protein
MKKVSSIATITLATLLTLSQFGCATPPNPPSTNANMATPEATPDLAAVEKELLRIENDWPRVIKERDGQAVRRVDADDVHLLSWDGSVSNKEDDAKFIESGAFTADSIQMNDLKVKVLDKDAAVVTGIMDIKNGKIKAPDRTIDVSGQYRLVDTFARRNNEWQLAASSLVKVANPAAPSASPTPKASPSASPAMKATPNVKPTPSVRPTPAARATPKVRSTPAVKPPTATKPPAPKVMSTPRPSPPPIN